MRKNSFFKGARHQRGFFSLPEVLIALAVVTLISFVVIGSVGPWLGLKQNIDNDRKMLDFRNALTSLYDTQAMAAEQQASGTFFGFTTSTIDGQGNCNVQSSPFVQLRTLINDSGTEAAHDGFGNPWCVFISPQMSSVHDGATVYYRNIGIVSAGRDGKLDGTSRMAANGTLTLGGDDVGFVVSGYDIQAAKLKETMDRMNRIATTYEGYFTTRFLSYADRDITRDYFSTAYDSGGSILSTGGVWANTSSLNAIGVSPSDAVTPWESNNAIQMGNNTEQVNGITVRSPATSGTGVLPYTALLRAQLPAPAGVTNYVTRVAVGNY
ncbi:hypothetical protein [Burkholderia cenocepacia]|uniref:type IV pilus modification PilV family protein n=1 Tax=Burkholderia cenocepacia TaxID=95486 RepID=UPI00076C7A7D|nr:hypothetical protein [Burkholderia cenocepacia]KWU17836.1 hypothetical protein AS149_14035 [Burkholderia cenocepacia]